MNIAKAIRKVIDNTQKPDEQVQGTTDDVGNMLEQGKPIEPEAGLVSQGVVDRVNAEVDKIVVERLKQDSKEIAQDDLNMPGDTPAQAPITEQAALELDATAKRLAEQREAITPKERKVKVLKAPDVVEMKVDWASVHGYVNHIAKNTINRIGVFAAIVIGVPCYIVGRLARTIYNAGKAGWDQKPINN